MLSVQGNVPKLPKLPKLPPMWLETDVFEDDILQSDIVGEFEGGSWTPSTGDSELKALQIGSRRCL